jgi:hypothetical protein
MRAPVASGSFGSTILALEGSESMVAMNASVKGYTRLASRWPKLSF